MTSKKMSNAVSNRSIESNPFHVEPLDQRHSLRDANDDCPGNLVMPRLFLPIPARPKKSKKQNDRRKETRQAAHQRDGEVNGRAIQTNHLDPHDNAANGCAFPGPHADVICGPDEKKERSAQSDETGKQDEIEKGRDQPAPKRNTGHYESC